MNCKFAKEELKERAEKQNVPNSASLFRTYAVFPPESGIQSEYRIHSYLRPPCQPHFWELVASLDHPSMALVLLLLGVILPTPLLAQSRDSEPLVVTGEQVVIAENTNLDILASQSV